MYGSGGHRSSISKPRNVEQIVKAAEQYEYNAQIPLRYWLRTAAALLKEADIYMQEGDEDTTYLLLFRHAHLVLAQLNAHPDSTNPSVQPLLSQALRAVNQNLKLLDVLKPKINQRYERYTKLMQEREAKRGVQQGRTSTDSFKLEDEPRQADKNKVEHLHGYEHSDLAVKLAQQEFLRRANNRESSDRSAVSGREAGDDLSQRLQAVRARVEPRQSTESVTTTRPEGRFDTGTGYSYPSVKPRETSSAFQYQFSQPATHPRANLDHAETPPPLPKKPPKESAHTPSDVPPRPQKLYDIETESTQTSKATAEPTYSFKPTAFLENGDPLRTLFLPPTLRTTFLRIAHQNTRANLETCGFLGGTLISNALFVSKLIIPAQIATSDTCEMTNESQLFDYVDSAADLMILGWIHTHPTQTCFMSSRDLHTHAGYQMMLPESVAVVCAPSKGDTTHGGDWGVYRLTDPPGKMAILNCNKPGIFHPHDVDHVYTDAVRPGHVVEAKGLDFEVVDLRNA